MGKYINDKRVVLTLDAGGNSLRFNAMRGEEFILETITLPSNANNLDLCLQSMVTGFKTVINLLGDVKPEAISFAFPGPADYPAGIIGGYLWRTFDASRNRPIYIIEKDSQNDDRR